MTDPFYEGLRAAIRDAIASHFDTYTDEELREFATESLNLPKYPTLADMTDEERDDCQWMQADVTGAVIRAVIVNPDWEDGIALTLWPGGAIERVGWRDVTPRPDLPRMAWPGTEKPAPAPSLPEGWRLADHRKYGRVVVTRTIPAPDCRAYFVFPDGHPTGQDWDFCRLDELTYIDQEADQ